MQQDFQTELQVRSMSLVSFIFPRCFVLRLPYFPSIPWWQAAKEMTRAREKALEESGLSHGHITEART